MSYVIIGTAGHIDHGKTTLIGRLTGIATDRLKEEKKRGITIELGFAYFDLPSGKRAGIVDVPGHEKFIKHMLAGASGMDIVVLVISAEEGIMPQTREHIDILNILGVSSGIVCLSKSDLVDEEWLEMIKIDIETGLQGSFLEKAPIIPVGMDSEDGLNELKHAIDKIALEIKPKNSQGMARLPIDRVFSLTGFGTVVTGTLIEGSISVGDKLTLYPSDLEARVRSIQVHSQDVEKAYSGQRVAINIANLKVNDIARGDVLANSGSMKKTFIVDANVNLLKNSQRELDNWTRVRVYHGSNEVLARMVILDSEKLLPGQNAFVQLRLEEEIAVKYGDRFVLRFYSPMETIGGGIILDPNANKHKRFKDDVLEALINKNSGDEASIVEELIFKHSEIFPEISEIVELTGLDKEHLELLLTPIIENGNIIKLSGRHYIHRAYLEKKNEETIEILAKFYEKNTLKIGMLKDELRSKLFGKIKPKVFDEIIDYYIKNNTLELHGKVVSTKNRKIEYTERQLRLKDDMLREYESYGFNPPNINEVCEKIKMAKKDMNVYESLVDNGELTRLNETLNLSRIYYEKAKEILVNYIKENKEISLATFRDLIQSSRKISVAILDYFDSNGLTYRDGDVRKLK